MRGGAPPRTRTGEVHALRSRQIAPSHGGALVGGRVAVRLIRRLLLLLLLLLLIFLQLNLRKLLSSFIRHIAGQRFGGNLMRGVRQRRRADVFSVCIPSRLEHDHLARPRLLLENGRPALRVVLHTDQSRPRGSWRPANKRASDLASGTSGAPYRSFPTPTPHPHMGSRNRHVRFPLGIVNTAGAKCGLRPRSSPTHRQPTSCRPRRRAPPSCRRSQREDRLHILRQQADESLRCGEAEAVKMVEGSITALGMPVHGSEQARVGLGRALGKLPGRVDHYRARARRRWERWQQDD